MHEITNKFDRDKVEKQLLRVRMTGTTTRQALSILSVVLGNPNIIFVIPFDEGYPDNEGCKKLLMTKIEDLAKKMDLKCISIDRLSGRIMFDGEMMLKETQKTLGENANACIPMSKRL